MPPISPNEHYLKRKSRFGRSLTVYGRKAVLEALQCADVRCERLHLARSNRPATILDDILTLATSQGAEVRHLSREELARISRHAREDQGVAADLCLPRYRQLEDLLPWVPEPGATLLAIDGITNPQNLGMLIRSATAAGCGGILVPRSGGCDICPLTIKASAGTVFRAPLLRCDALAPALTALQECGWRVCVLDTDAPRSLFEPFDTCGRIFVLGGETAGVSTAIRQLADESCSIPMANGVESLNVAVSAALVAFRAHLAADRAQRPR